MKKIDTSKWKDFRVAEIFLISRPSSRSMLDYEDGEIPFVASGNFNNGIAKKCQPKENEKLDVGNCITVSPLDGSAFYQKCDFLGRGGAGSAILIMRSSKLNELRGLFISSVIRRSLTRYSYSDQINSESLKNESIKLPSTDDGEPDWDYMDTYMSEMLKKSERCLENLRDVSTTKKSINIKEWKEFNVGELFPNIWKPKVLHTRQVEESDTGLPYVVRTKFDNGLKYRIKTLDEIEPTPPGCISWGAENPSFFYQEEAFYSGRDIYCIDTRKLSRGACMFLCACLQRIADKYSYNFGLFPKHLKSETIYLPVNREGLPDWDSMDSYMNRVLEQSEDNFKELTQI